MTGEYSFRKRCPNRPKSKETSEGLATLSTYRLITIGRIPLYTLSGSVHDQFLLFRTMLEATVEAPYNGEIYGVTDGESCPECSHVWFLDAPAHFTDCRYFSLDDDRDE